MKTKRKKEESVKERTPGTKSGKFPIVGIGASAGGLEALEQFLKEHQRSLDKVINIHVKTEILVERAVGRRVCQQCGATYHIKFKPTEKENICDLCGGEVIQRRDDQRETAEKRIQVYEQETAPLINYYEKRDLLVTIDGEQSIDKVKADISNALKDA